MILAAGYATRLYPLTKKFPKPLLEVKGRPIIDYILEKIAEVDSIDEVFIVTNSKFIAVFKRWAKKVKLPKKITLVDDCTRSNRDRLGAIGDINFVVKKNRLADDLLVVGGDNLFSASLNGFLQAAKKHSRSTSIGLYKLKRRQDAVRYGVVKLDSLKRVVGFEEKPLRPKSNLVAMCLYYIPAGHLRWIQAYLQDKHRKADATGSYIAWLKDRARVYGCVFGGSWFDIGDYKYLNAAKKY